MARKKRPRLAQRLKVLVADLQRDLLAERREFKRQHAAMQVLIKSIDSVKMENMLLRRERDELRTRWEANVNAIRSTYGRP